MKLKNIDKYIQSYDVEKYLFTVIGPKIRKKKYLSFNDFYQIVMWKSVRPKLRYISNQKQIEQISKRALSQSSEVEKIQTLCELNGVGIPTASAILTIIYPEKYAVIDIRCLEALNDILKIKISKSISLKTWLKYLEIMRNIAKENNVTPRKLDMALFAMHKENLDKQKYRNLYSS